MLLNLQSLAGKRDLNLRVDLRSRDAAGRVMYSHQTGPIAGTLTEVRIRTKRDRARGARKWLYWCFKADDPNQVPHSRGYSGVVVGAKSRTYHLMTLDDYRVNGHEAGQAPR